MGSALGHTSCPRFDVIICTVAPTSTAMGVHHVGRPDWRTVFAYLDGIAPHESASPARGFDPCRTDAICPTFTQLTIANSTAATAKLTTESTVSNTVQVCRVCFTLRLKYFEMIQKPPSFT